MSAVVLPARFRLLQGMANAEDSAIGEWAGGVCAERPNGPRRSSRVGSVDRLGSKRPTDSPGFERCDPRAEALCKETGTASPKMVRFVVGNPVTTNGCARPGCGFVRTGDDPCRRASGGVHLRTTRWPVFSLPTKVPRRSRWREGWMRRSPSC
jgi:hypothetical protein